MKYMTNLAKAFNEFYKDEAHLYMNFLLGRSQYMLVENVPDSEISENLSRESNPDYDVMKSQRQQSSPHDQDSTLIMSKMFESMIKPIEASHAQQIAALNQQIADKQTIIDLQSDKIKSQAEDIDRLQKIIADLRSMPTTINIEEVLKKYPFEIGVADQPDTTSAQI